MSYANRHRIFFVLAVMGISLLRPMLHATTYYVDSAKGLDTNTGKVSTAAWQTIAKVNLASLAPGDSVLFSTTGVWHEQLNVTRSGTAAAPITFASYGSSGQPILDGADVVRGWNLVTGNTYCAVYHASAHKGYVDALYQQARPLGPAGSLARVESTAGSLYSDGNYVYVHLLDGSNPNNHVIEVSGARLYNIVVTSQSHLVFSGLQLVRAARSGFLGNSNVDNYSGQLTNEYISLTNMTVYNWGNTLNDMGWDGGYGGIYVYGVSVHPQLAQRGWSVTHNYCGIADVAPVLAYHVGCIDLEATTGALIDHNVVAAINAFGIEVAAFFNGDPCASPTISYNDISMSEGNIRIAGCPNAIATHNNIHDSNGYGINLDSDEDPNFPEYSTGVQLLSNTITNLLPSSDGKLYNGIDCNKGSSGGTADGNVIRQVSGNSLTLEADSFLPGSAGQPCSGWTLSNNTLDSSHDWTVFGGTPGRTGPLYIRDMAIPGLKLANNTYIMNANYHNGMSYGFANAGDYSHDLGLLAFEAIAPNGGGASSQSVP